MPNASETRNQRMGASVLLGLLIAVMAFFTYFWNYTNPPFLYWDENYHIASAQKYLNGVYFMEPHPPLGKLLIAAGEKLLNANVGADDEFIGTDYAKELPSGFSFKGYRFFPVFLGWAIAPLLYLIFLLITRKPVWAVLLSFLYVFDNALITHSRAAMLDSTMLFFCVAMIALYLLVLRFRHHRHAFPLLSLLLGIAFAGAMGTKALAMIMILLWPVMILHLRKRSNVESQMSRTFALRLSTFDFQKICQFLVLSTAGFLIVYVAIWQLHFSIGKRIVDSLPDNGYYQASEEYKTLLGAGRISLPLMMRDNLRFLKHYSTGVPPLNLCKADENGSPFFLWPFGARAINYRWETPDGSLYQYLTLQINPVVWGLSLIGLLLAFVLILGSFLLHGAKKPEHRHDLMLWSLLWLSYMIAVSRIDRVLYLYHYFIPLLFSFILLGYVLLDLKKIGAWALDARRKDWLLLACGLMIFASFHFYRPLSYYEPISDVSFRKRMIFPLWELRCVNCEKKNLMANPLPPESP